MTKDEKLTLVQSTKASAFDELCTTYDCDLSHRHFHACVERIIQQARAVIQGINDTPDTSLSFKCVNCGESSTCQVYKGHQHADLEDFGKPMCEACATVALNTGTYQIVEETPLQNE